MSQALGRRGHRDRPHLPARRLLRRMVGVHTRRRSRLLSIGAGDQAVTVLRAGRRGVRPLHAGRVSDGRASARRTYRRRPASTADHRPAGEAAGARSALGRPDPSAQQPGRGNRPRSLGSAREDDRDAAQTRDVGRRQVHAGGAARARDQYPGRGRRAGRQVQERRSSPRWRPPTARSRSANGSRTTASRARGIMHRRSSMPAWTSTGWNEFRHRSTRSTHPRRCRAPSDG